MFTKEIHSAGHLPRMLKSVLVATALLAGTGCHHHIVFDPHSYSGGHDVTICHKGKKTMTLPAEAARGHMNHGDYYGHC